MKREEQMKHHELQALWWMHAATNGAALRRKMFHGFGDIELTDAEKVTDAMNTSRQHADLYKQLAETNESGETAGKESTP